MSGRYVSVALAGVALTILVEPSFGAGRGFHGFGHPAVGSVHRNFMHSSRGFGPGNGFAPGGRFVSNRGFAPGTVRMNSGLTRPAAIAPLSLRAVPVVTTPGMRIPAGSGGMVTRRLNVNPAASAVTAVPATSQVNRLQPTTGIRPNIVFQNTTPFFPRHHHHHLPFFGSGFPFYGYGYPYQFYGDPYGGYGYGSYANPYALAGAYGYGDAYPGAVNPYITGSAGPGPYGASSSPIQSDASAHLEVVLPDANAEVWLNGEKTTGQGTTRLFTTPPLERGMTQAVTVRVAWRDGGQNMTVERTINVTAGTRVRVEFSGTPVRVTSR